MIHLARLDLHLFLLQTRIKNDSISGSAQHHIKPLTLRYKHHSITVKQPGYWCNACGEGVIGGEDRKATQKELQSLRARIDGLIAPEQLLDKHPDLLAELYKINKGKLSAAS